MRLPLVKVSFVFIFFAKKYVFKTKNTTRVKAGGPFAKAAPKTN